MEDLNTTVKSLQSKLSFMEIDIDSVKDEQKNLDEKFTHMERLILNLLMIVLTNFKAVWKKVRRKSTNVIRKFFIYRLIVEGKT